MRKIFIIASILMLVLCVSCSDDTVCTVKFDTQVQEITVDSIAVVRGSKFNPSPSNPVREGYAFGGWFTDKECTDPWDYNSIVTENMTLYADWNQAFMTFTSTEPFSVKAEGFWEGKLYYSLDGSNWIIYDKSRVSAGQNWSKDYYNICFRGEGNTVIVGDRYFGETTGKGMGTWSFKNKTSGKAESITCNGNIMTLLDYKKILDEKDITIGKSAFAYMFYGQNIVSIPTIPAISGTIGEKCFYSTFADCNKIDVTTTKPQSVSYKTFYITATDVDKYCYEMFENSTRGKDFVKSGTTYYIYKKDV